MSDRNEAEEAERNRPVMPEVGGKMGESKGVWRVLATSILLAVAALAVVGAFYGGLF